MRSSPPSAHDPDARARFEREAKTISQLKHPHICTLYDVGTDAAAPGYLVRPDGGVRSATTPGVSKVNATKSRPARAVSSPGKNPLEDASWIHSRVEAPRRGALEVENRHDREQSERKGSDTQGAQDLAGEEDVDGEARAFVAAKHERADERRNQEIDEPIPRSPAAEVEPLPIEPEGHEMDDRTDQ